MLHFTDTQIVEAALVFIAHGEGVRARDTLLETQDSGHSLRPWEGTP